MNRLLDAALCSLSRSNDGGLTDSDIKYGGGGVTVDNGINNVRPAYLRRTRYMRAVRAPPYDNVFIFLIF